MVALQPVSCVTSLSATYLNKCDGTPAVNMLTLQSAYCVTNLEGAQTNKEVVTSLPQPT